MRRGRLAGLVGLYLAGAVVAGAHDLVTNVNLTRLCAGTPVFRVWAPPGWLTAARLDRLCEGLETVRSVTGWQTGWWTDSEGSWGGG